MPADEAARFVTACVQPAVARMEAALAKRDTPYRHVISGLAHVIRRKWGESRESDDVLQSRPRESDPLHAFPVAEIGCGGGCSADCGEQPVVQLQPHPATAPEPFEPDSGAKENRS